MLYRSTVTRRRKDGTQYTEQSARWWGRYEDPKTGQTVQVKLGTSDRSAARLLLSEAERKAARAATGRADRYESHRGRVLAEHLAE